ncbi:hypothetical protein JG688_00011539 [Phytophthora aleatoria]|uniref:Uncharacterized protein n=1 Tax=Phytophthora aleatoria TaxID=2496075 RepID=A0A8J5MEP6_9STRA|nr:hypothetical protein JG688_00011539 [Phytophthora aleatoria]
MGNMNAHAPCCSTVKYAVLNTVDYGWTDDTLQQKFCDHALSMSDSSDVIAHSIRDTVVVTHSMGGLVMWQLESADLMSAQRGNYYDGVVSQYQVQSVIAGKIIPHKSRKNDGLVEFQSCAAGLSESLFGDSYEYRFYAPSYAHQVLLLKAFVKFDNLYEELSSITQGVHAKAASNMNLENQKHANPVTRRDGVYNNDKNDDDNGNATEVSYASAGICDDTCDASGLGNPYDASGPDDGDACGNYDGHHRGRSGDELGDGAGTASGTFGRDNDAG